MGTIMDIPAAEAGFRQRSNSCYDHNLSHIYRRDNELCSKWNMPRDDFEKAACVYALVFREHAPRNTQMLYTGRPSLYSQEAKRLALAFFLVYVEASERLAALNDSDGVNALACWKIALSLMGGTA